MSWTKLDGRETVDAIYSFRKGESAWADKVHTTLSPLMNYGQGTLVTLVDLAQNGLKLEYIRRHEANAIHTGVLKLTAFLAKKKLREAFFNGKIIGASQGFYEDTDLSLMQDGATRAGSRDALGFCVNDTADSGFMIVSPSKGQICLDLNQQAILKKLGQHVANALRLQRAVGSLKLDDPTSEAIFSRKEQCDHVEGMARDDPHFGKLKEAVHRFFERREKSAKALEQIDPVEAIVSGRWSLVSRVDNDGKEFVVAYRNPEGVIDSRKLTKREQDVVAMASVGKSNKEIAADLGIRTSTVGSLLGNAMEKMHLNSRTKIPQFWKNAKGKSWPIANSDGRLICIECEGNSRDTSDRLTPSERNVAVQIANGTSRKMIAQRRGVSPRTIDKQTESIYRKLGIQSRNELAQIIFNPQDSLRPS